MEIKGLVKEIVNCHDHNEHYLLLNGAEVAQTISNDLYEEKSILFNTSYPGQSYAVSVVQMIVINITIIILIIYFT